MKISLITSRLLLGASLGAAALHAADSQTPPQTTQPPSPLIINHYDISLRTEARIDENNYFSYVVDEAKKQEFESFLANAIAEIKTQIKELEDKKKQIGTGGGESNADTNQGWLDVALGNTHTTEDKTYLAGVLDKITAQDSVINEDFVSLKVETKKLSDIMTSINATGDTQAAKEDAKKTFEVILGSSKGEYVSQSIAQMTNATFFRDLTTALNTGNRAQNDAILTSLIGSSTDAAIGMGAITNAGFFKDMQSTAHASTNTTSEQSSANATMNIANDMAIGGRIAKTNNPYEKQMRFARMLKNSLFAAAGSSDARYDYYGNATYDNSLWANVFGGANIIGGNSGGLYGVSVGYDSDFKDKILLGVYATYTNSTINDTNLTQGSHNYQIGLYTSYRFVPKWELNAKVYGQFADTTQSISLAGTGANSEFMRTFVGANLNVGRVFDISSVFLKPFVGLNYYYSSTPAQTQTGSLAQNISAYANNAMSVEVGLETRKYFSESSYLFVIPKIEQYVLNSGGDYIASFVGSSTAFSIASADVSKTYGRLIIGGNIAFGDSFSMTVGVGAKQLFAGEVDNKSETYLSGNLGVKWKF